MEQNPSYNSELRATKHRIVTEQLIIAQPARHCTVSWTSSVKVRKFITMVLIIFLNDILDTTYRLSFSYHNRVALLRLQVTLKQGNLFHLVSWQNYFEHLVLFPASDGRRMKQSCSVESLGRTSLELRIGSASGPSGVRFISLSSHLMKETKPISERWSEKNLRPWDSVQITEKGSSVQFRLHILSIYIYDLL
jgi:hypothetical protein